jgi:hypothetical protein
MLPLLLGAAALLALSLPASADAHGIVGKADLPIPVWLFSWTAAIVLVVSFVALSTLWRTPHLQVERRRRVFARASTSRPRSSPTQGRRSIAVSALEALAGLIGVALFALVVYSGFDGAQVANANFSVTFVYVIFWVGLPVLSVIFGDVFKAFNPWRATARACEGTVRLLRGASAGRDRGPLLSYPQALGQWPALVGIVGFAWLELVYVNRDDPSTLAALALGYFGVMLAGMLLFGVEQWGGSADGFGIYFGLLARISPLVRDEQATSTCVARSAVCRTSNCARAR